MNQENSQILIHLYPELLSENFYFECGDGWFEIIKELLRNIKDIHESKNSFSSSNYPKVIQIKEKYGYIFVYLDCDFRDFKKVIEDARNKSKVTCEICGDEGGVSSTEYGMVYTRCYEHRIGR